MTYPPPDQDTIEATLRSQDRRLLFQLKEHVVQTEALVTYVAICVIVLYVLDHSGISLPVWLVPCIFLVGLRWVVRVTNPTSVVRNALVWGGVFAGVAGAIVGASADIMTGGLTGGQGTLLGYAGGAAAGAAVGNWIESWGKKHEMLERGDAFDYLYPHRKKDPRIASAKLVNDVLDHEISSYDKNEDGRKWYALDDLKEFLKKRPKKNRKS